MSDKENTSLVPRPAGELVRLSPGASAIIDSMVNEATDIIRTRETDRKEQAGSQSDIRLDPEVFEAGIRVSGYYIEGGICKFADFARRMVEEFGEKIKPYLKAFYNGVRNYFKELVSSDMQPYAGEIAATMDSAEAVEEMAEPEALEEILNGEADENIQVPPSEPMRRGRADE